MRYFITGSTGFIGRRIAQQLCHAGHSVVALVRDLKKGRCLAEHGAELVEGDILDKNSMHNAMRGCDGLFHVAGCFKIGKAFHEEVRQVNIEGTRNVLELMKEAAIPKGVYTSSIAIFSNTNGQFPDESFFFSGKHLTEYDRTKWEAHYNVALKMIAAGLPLVIVMPGAVYGKNDHTLLGRTLELYSKGHLPLVPAKVPVCWAHVDDTARGHILAMEKGQVGQSYILACPAHTIAESLSMHSRITGKKHFSLQTPTWLFRLCIPFLRFVSVFISLPEIYSVEAVRLIAGITYLGNNAKAKKELGYSPRGLEEGFGEVFGG